MQFLYVNVLFFMLIPALILIALIILKNSSLEKYFSKEALKKLSLNNKYFSKKARNITLSLALFFMIIALARPVINEKEQDIKEEKHSLVLALDISKSMLANDIYPNRLEFAKIKINEFIKNAHESNLALILFAKSSFILSPLTSDFNSLKIIVNNLDKGLNFDSGTNIYSAIESANKLLKDYKSKNLIILSDGADKKDFSQEIDLANKYNIKVYNLGLATKKGSPIKQKDGNYLTNNKGEIVNLSLNENIKDLSFKTNAAYIKYSLDDYDVKALLNEISKKSSKEEGINKKYKTYTELFYYPLALALFLILIAFSSLPAFKRASIFLALIFFSSNTNLEAFDFDFQTIEKAQKAYKKKEYKEALKNYEKLPLSNEQQYNLGNSYYKNGEYEKAITSFKNVQGDNRNLNFNSLHNLGNSYVKANKFQEAIKAYEEALKIKDEKETKENLDAVKKAINKKNKNKNKNSKDNKKDKQKNKQKNKEKNQKKNKDSNKNQKQDKKQNNESKENSKDNKKEQKEKDTQKKSSKTKNKTPQKDIDNKEKHISDLEEKKWLKKLEHYKSKPLLKEFKSDKKFQGENPW